MNIALIAHDGKKPELVSFFLKNKDLFQNSKIYATATTGSHLVDMGIEVNTVLSGPLGGDAQIASVMVEGGIDLIFFFRDPLGKHPHEPDVQMLMRLCDVHNIPLATNPAAAELMLRALKAKLHEQR